MTMIFDEEDELEDEDEFYADDYDAEDLSPSVPILWPPTDWHGVPL